jgi:hypothetical protein
MTVVSTKEFNTHQRKYFDMAPHEQYPEQSILEPDDDLRNAITIDGFRKGAHEIIHDFFAGI